MTFSHSIRFRPPAGLVMLFFTAAGRFMEAAVRFMKAALPPGIMSTWHLASWVDTRLGMVANSKKPTSLAQDDMAAKLIAMGTT